MIFALPKHIHRQLQYHPLTLRYFPTEDVLVRLHHLERTQQGGRLGLLVLALCQETECAVVLSIEIFSVTRF